MKIDRKLIAASRLIFMIHVVFSFFLFFITAGEIHAEILIWWWRITWPIFVLWFSDLLLLYLSRTYIAVRRKGNEDTPNTFKLYFLGLGSWTAWKWILADIYSLLHDRQVRRSMRKFSEYYPEQATRIEIISRRNDLAAACKELDKLLAKLDAVRQRETEKQAELALEFKRLAGKLNLAQAEKDELFKKEGLVGSLAFLEKEKKKMTLLRRARELECEEMILAYMEKGEWLLAESFLIRAKAYQRFASELGVVSEVKALFKEGRETAIEKLLKETSEMREKEKFLKGLEERIAKLNDWQKFDLTQLLEKVKAADKGHEFRRLRYDMEKILQQAEKESVN